MYLESTTDSNAWWYLPSLVKFLRKSRLENFSEMYCMNISIILHSATIIEGFMNELLSEFIGESIRDETLNDRLNKELNQRIERSSWNDLQYLYKLIFGKELSTDTDNDTWKGINSLFDFRNMLTHGKIIRLSVFNDNGKRKIQLFGKYEKVYNFLAKEKKVIEKVYQKGDSASVNLITNESADYYWFTTLEFIEQIFMLNRKIVPSIETSFEIAFEDN